MSPMGLGAKIICAVEDQQECISHSVYYLPPACRIVTAFGALSYCQERTVAIYSFFYIYKTVIIIYQSYGSTGKDTTEQKGFVCKAVLTCAATSPACSLGKSVCDQGLLAQGTILRRSSPKRKSRSRLCRNFRMFHGRSLCLEHKLMTRLLVRDLACNIKMVAIGTELKCQLAPVLTGFASMDIWRHITIK
jgi:hypothetical protein